jgi:hypothetical protein
VVRFGEAGRGLAVTARHGSARQGGQGQAVRVGAGRQGGQGGEVEVWSRRGSGKAVKVRWGDGQARSVKAV